MRKRILSILCAFAIMAVMIPQDLIMAQTTAEELMQASELLKKLNLFTESRISHDSLIYSLAGFLYDDPGSAGSAEQIGRMTGMIEEDEKYTGRDSVSFDEAVKYAVTVLGYKQRAEQLGGYPEGYQKIAADLKITYGISLSGDSVLKTNDAVKLIYQMLDAEPMVSFYNGEGDKGYSVEKGETLLSLNRDIYEINGLMTANSETSIYSEKGTVENQIVIDGEEYEVSDTNDESFLGRNVTAYFKQEKNEDKKIIYIGENAKRNNTVTIEAENIEEVAEDYSKIKYSDSSDKLKSLNLSAVPRVIYNGVYYGKYTQDDLSPDIGSLRLIDNDADGKYDVIFVTSYETVIVESADAGDKVIRNKYRFDGCLDVLDLEPDDGSVKYSIYKDGADAAIEDIKNYDVLSVARSKNTEKQIIKIYISGKAPFEGTVRGRNDSEHELNINDEIYYMPEEFRNFINDTQKVIEAGAIYNIYLDYFGNIAYLKYQINSDYKLMLKMYEDYDSYYAVYMDLNEEWKTGVFAERVTVITDDGKLKLRADEAYKELCESEPQVMIIKENAKGEIKEIETASVTSKYKENRFTKTVPGKYVYRSEPKSLGMEFFLENSAKMFVFPETAVMDRNSYYVRDATGYFSSNLEYTVTAYDLDNFSFTDLLSVRETESEMAERTSKSMFVITGFSSKCVDDEVLPCISGNMGEYKNLSLVGKDEKIFEGLKPGDIINLNTNTEGRVNCVKKVFSLSDFKELDTSNYYAETAVIAGIIEDIDYAEGKIKINCGRSVPMRLNSSMPVQTYNLKRSKCELKTAGDLIIGDKIVCRLSRGNISEMVCLKMK